MATYAEVDVDYLAAFDPDTEAFVDLVRSDADGLYYRTDGEDWQEYQPGDLSLDGMSIIDVQESFIPLVDKLLSTGNAPSIADAEKHAADDGKVSE